MSKRYFRAALAMACAATAVLHGCSCDPTKSADSKVPGKCQDQPILLSAQKTDILFVIDNSGSMREEQNGVAIELPAFVSTLANGGGGIAQDFQAGVITTTVYERVNDQGHIEVRTFGDQAGALRPVPWLDGGTFEATQKVVAKDDPDLADKFGRLVRQGVDGSGQETPFEAVRRAAVNLKDIPQADGGNAGFFRDGARLLVVVVSDEDDCSETRYPPSVTMGFNPGEDYCTEQSSFLTPVSTYFDSFHALTDSTGAARDVMWAAIAPVSDLNLAAQEITTTLGDGGLVSQNVDCPTSNGPGYRQRQMAELFDNQLRNLASICQASYHDTLVNIAGLAAVSQVVEMGENVPDPGLLQVKVTRADNTVQTCTTSNGGILFEAAVDGRKPRIHFTGSCLHRADDKAINVSMLCAL